MNSFEERSKELIQELHEIEESLISDDKLKATIVTAGDQLRKVFGEGGYYDKYIQSLITSDIQDDNIILQNMISLNNKSKIVATNAVTN